MPTVYRATMTNPPTATDFTSNKGLGKVRRAPRETEALWSGISVFDTASQCRKVARKWSLGLYVAEVKIPNDASITWSDASGSGHRTAWGAPEEFLRYVGAVQPVNSEETKP